MAGYMHQQPNFVKDCSLSEVVPKGVVQSGG